MGYSATRRNSSAIRRRPPILRTNFISAAAWCEAVAAVLERQRSGALLVIGSVAGDRGRGSNYIYGASKAGLGVLVQGIAHRLANVRSPRGPDQASDSWIRR